MKIRDSKTCVDKDWYEQDLEDSEILADLDHNPSDWEFNFVSRKLYGILYYWSDTDVKKVLAGAADRCGLEAYRLINKEYDPVNDG